MKGYKANLGLIASLNVIDDPGARLGDVVPTSVPETDLGNATKALNEGLRVVGKTSRTLYRVTTMLGSCMLSLASDTNRPAMASDAEAAFEAFKTSISQPTAELVALANIYALEIRDLDAAITTYMQVASVAVVDDASLLPVARDGIAQIALFAQSINKLTKEFPSLLATLDGNAPTEFKQAIRLEMHKVRFSVTIIAEESSIFERWEKATSEWSAAPISVLVWSEWSPRSDALDTMLHRGLNDRKQKG